MDREEAAFRDSVAELERAHNILKGRLVYVNPDVDPYEITDTIGRPILINSLSNLVFARAVLHFSRQ